MKSVDIQSVDCRERNAHGTQHETVGSFYVVFNFTRYCGDIGKVKHSDYRTVMMKLKISLQGIFFCFQWYKSYKKSAKKEL